MSRFLRRATVTVALTAAVSASVAVPANAWENTYQSHEEAGNSEGTVSYTHLTLPTNREV